MTNTAPELPRERIIGILESGGIAETVTLLQAMFMTAPAGMNMAMLDSIQALSTHQDLAVRFWAKKVFKKYSFQFCRDEPERFSDAAEEGMLPLEILSRILRDVRHSKFLAMKVLKKICRNNSSQALEILTAHLKATQDPFQISFLTKNLGIHFPSDALIPLLTPFLTHADDRVIANTIEGIEAIGSPRCFEIISRFIKHRNNRIRATAAKAISGFDSKRTYEILTKMLGSKGQSHLVISACHAVAELRDPRFFPHLQNLLTDDLILDDVLKAMKAIDEPHTIEVLRSQIDRTEARLAKMRRVLPGLPEVIATHETIVTLRKSPLAAWVSELDWTDLLFNRFTLALALILSLGLGGSFVANRLQNPQVRKAREELAKLRLPLSPPAFHRAITAGNQPAVEWFIQAGISPNARGDNGAAALHVAAFAGHTGLIDRLLGLGGEINAGDAKGLTPLHLAASRPVVERLLKAGANPHARDTLGRTPLHTAAESGASEIVELLIGSGADINVQARDGNTPLHLALLRKRQKTALYLLARGANPDIRNQDGVSPRAMGLPTSFERKGRP